MGLRGGGGNTCCIVSHCRRQSFGATSPWRSSKFQPVYAIAFLASRCLAELCVSTDLADFRRTVADGRDQNRNLTCWMQTCSFFSSFFFFRLQFSLFIFVYFFLSLPLHPAPFSRNWIAFTHVDLTKLHMHKLVRRQSLWIHFSSAE